MARLLLNSDNFECVKAHLIKYKVIVKMQAVLSL